MPTSQRSIQWYEEHAQEYTNHVRNSEDSIYHSLYEKPTMYDMLPDIRGMSVISLGCGSGEDCNYLQQQAPSKVIGIDISKNLIAIAQSSYPNCHFEVMDMENLSFEDQSFDFAYSSLAIHYLEDWTKAFSEVYKILKPGSYFLFSCSHPVYSAMDTVKENETVKVKQLARRKDKLADSVEIDGNYMDRKPLTFETGLAVTTWHKSISEISSEASQAGFLIANIVEPKPLLKMAEISPNDYETLIKIPNFIIFKLYRPL
jgi:ubiquinone/menaquinone biosynthesis C-methylase UbiE